MSLAFFPLYPDDFEADTAHLTLCEDGAFNRLLRLCWRTPGCSVPSDRAWVYRRMRAHTEADQAVVETVIAEFFKEVDGRLSNARLTKEWLAANEAHTRRKNAGSKGGKAKAQKTNETEASNATAKPKQPEPQPEPLVTVANATVGDTATDQPKRAAQPKSGARGSRLPNNWTPTPKDYAFASSEGLTREEINREADRFRDHWTAASGRNACKLDWEATWRNWLRSDYRKPNRAAAKPTGPGQAGGAFDRVIASVHGALPERRATGGDDPGAYEPPAIDGQFTVISAGDEPRAFAERGGSHQADAGALFAKRRA